LDGTENRNVLKSHGSEIVTMSKSGMGRRATRHQHHDHIPDRPTARAEAVLVDGQQGPIERHHGLLVAILVTGTMFGVAHFRPVLWPYYFAVAAIYGVVTYLTNSILPSVVLHTAGNLYSNLDLWLHGQAEWQAGSRPERLIWETGPDASFWTSIAMLVVVGAAMLWAYFRLARAARTVHG
jgi:hypothetical protein